MPGIPSLKRKQIVITKKDILAGTGEFAFTKGTPLVISGVEYSYWFVVNDRVLPNYYSKEHSMFPEGNAKNRYPGIYVHCFTNKDMDNFLKMKMELSATEYPLLDLNFRNRYNIMINDDSLIEKINYQLVPYIPSKKVIPYYLLKTTYGDKINEQMGSKEGYGINIVYKYNWDARKQNYDNGDLLFGMYKNSRVSSSFIHNFSCDKLCAFHKERCKTFNGILQKVKELREELLFGAESVEVRFGNEKELITEELSDLLSVVFTLDDIRELKGGD